MMDTSMAARQNATPPAWLVEKRSRVRLLLDVLLGVRANLEKFLHVVQLVVAYLCPSVVRARLERLRSLGHIQHTPTISQMLVAARDQMMLSAAEETKLFYKSQGIPWVFHNFRRFLAGPATMMDPVGLFSPRDAIIAHVLQTFHRHPVYDLVLLRAYEDGVEQLEQQTREVLSGSHYASRALRSLIEDGSYHRRLLTEIQTFQADPFVPARPIPDGLVPDPYMMLGMDQFKDLQGFTSYASQLPVGFKHAVVAWLQVGFNEALGGLMNKRLGPQQVQVQACEPTLVRKHLQTHA